VQRIILDPCEDSWRTSGVRSGRPMLAR